MLDLDGGAKSRDGSSGMVGEPPAGWIGAKDLPSLTLQLGVFGENAVESFGELAEALFALDDESRALIEADRRRFFEVATGGVSRGEVPWKIVRTFLDQLFSALSDLVLRDCYDAQGGLLSPAGRAELMARTLRAGAGVTCWDAFRYGPFDDADWARLGHVFSLALESGCADHEVPLPGSGEPTTTPRREFLHAMAVRCAGFERLPVELMDGVDRLIRQLLPQIGLRPDDPSGALYCVRLGDGTGPLRVTQMLEDGPALWYFSPQAAMEGLGTGGLVSARLEAGAAHLRRLWGRQQPVRRYRRYPMDGQLGLVQHWDEMVVFLSGLREVAGSPFALADVSRGGLGVRAPAGAVTATRVGDLVGMRAQDGGEWQLGVVRRLQRDRDQSMRLGIEILTRTPMLVEADDGRASAVGVACDPVRPGGVVRLLAPADSFREGAPVFLKVDATVLKLTPRGCVIRARMCDLQSFQVS